MFKSSTPLCRWHSMSSTTGGFDFHRHFGASIYCWLFCFAQCNRPIGSYHRHTACFSCQKRSFWHRKAIRIMSLSSMNLKLWSDPLRGWWTLKNLWFFNNKQRILCTPWHFMPTDLIWTPLCRWHFMSSTTGGFRIVGFSAHSYTDGFCLCAQCNRPIGSYNRHTACF